MTSAESADFSASADARRGCVLSLSTGSIRISRLQPWRMGPARLVGRDPALGLASRSRAADRRPGAPPGPAGARPAVGAPPEPLLAGPRHGRRQHGTCLSDEPGRHPVSRRSPHPRVARVPRQRGIPRYPRARHARRPAPEAERGVRRGNADRSGDRLIVRGRIREPTGWSASGDRASLAQRPARGDRGRDSRMGDLLSGAGAAAGWPTAFAGGPRAAPADGRRRCCALRLRCLALRRDLPASWWHRPVVGRSSLRPAGRGDDRGVAEPQLAPQLVAVARPHAPRFRRDRARRAERVRAERISDRCVRWSLPRGDTGPRRPLARGGDRRRGRCRGTGQLDRARPGRPTP